MIREIQYISKQHGEKDTMSNNRQQLSKEILGLFGAVALMAIFFHFFMNTMANALISNYIYENDLNFSAYQMADMELWIQSISMVFSVLLFVVLFLYLIGERIAYITEIIKGIEALGRHDWTYEIPIQGNNELTELAERVNLLSKEEEALEEKEQKMQAEKESLIRALSHDIRTPLTSILSYSEFMQGKAEVSSNEMQEYMSLMSQKASQIKVLTDRLLEGGSRQLEYIENGRFLMEQLVYEWEAELENEFMIELDFENCPSFSGEFDVQELRRIFDNLASNVRKYADASMPVKMRLCKSMEFSKEKSETSISMETERENEHICIFQSNTCKKLEVPVESTKIGITSIERIVGQYGGGVEIICKEDDFSIKIILTECKSVY